jgi:hypothetical protein
MTTELTLYNGYRYVLHKGRSVIDDSGKIESPLGADGAFNREGGRSFPLLPW